MDRFRQSARLAAGPQQSDQQQYHFRGHRGNQDNPQPCADFGSVFDLFRRECVQHVRDQPADIPDLIHHTLDFLNGQSCRHPVADLEHVLLHRIHGPAGNGQLQVSAAFRFRQQFIQRAVCVPDQFLHAAFFKTAPSGCHGKQVLRDRGFQRRLHFRRRVHPPDHRLRPG